jgi:hypothetical protein
MEEKEFTWTDKLAAEFAIFIREKYRNSEVWSGNDEAEMSYIPEFKQSKQKQYPPGIIRFVDQNDENIKTIAWPNPYYKSYNEFVKHFLDIGHKIHSVQNGDEILTVMDEIKETGSGLKSKITNIRISENKIELSCDHSQLYYTLPCEIIKKVISEKTYTASEVQELFSPTMKLRWIEVENKIGVSEMKYETAVNGFPNYYLNRLMKLQQLWIRGIGEYADYEWRDVEIAGS